MEQRLLLELIAALHQGVLEETPWRGFVQKLRQGMGPLAANLVLREADSGTDELIAVEDYLNPPPPNYRERYFNEFRQDDPLPYFSMKPGGVYRFPELLGGQAPEANRFITEYLRPLGVADLLLFHAAEDGGCRAWVTVMRDDAAPAFSAGDVAAFKILAEHLSGALRVFAVLQEERMRRQLYEHVARQLNVDFLLLDAQGRLLREAQAVRVREAGLRIGADGRLHAPEQRYDEALQRAVTGARDGLSGAVLHIGDAPYLDVFVSPIADMQSAHPALGREMPAIIVYLHAGPRQVSSTHLEKLFGLSRTEAKLAAALVRGRTLTEAASEIGVTEQTARRYSKLIFSKTSTNRQSELVRRILGSGAILAP